MGTWLNSDGLYVKLGASEATSQTVGYPQGGEYKTIGGPTRESNTVITLTSLPAFGTAGILNDVEFFGAGWVPESVVLETLVAVTGSSATLSIGLIKNADRSTAISATALANAVTQTVLANVGTQVILVAGSTGAGGYIGVANTYDALLTATVGTANFSAGVVGVRVRWRPTVNL